MKSNKDRLLGQVIPDFCHTLNLLSTPNQVNGHIRGLIKQLSQMVDLADDSSFLYEPSFSYKYVHDAFVRFDSKFQLANDSIDTQLKSVQEVASRLQNMN